MDVPDNGADPKDQPAADPAPASGDPAGPGTPDPAGRESTVSPEIAKLQAEIEARDASIAKLNENARKLVDEKKAEQAKQRKALEEQGNFDEAMKLRDAELATIQEERATEAEALSTAQARAKELESYVEPVRDLAKQQLDSLPDSSKEHFEILYPEAAKDDADPRIILEALGRYGKAFPNGARKSPGSAIPGGGGASGTFDAREAEFIKTGNVSGLIGLHLGQK